ncbi:MAG: hypothetical protein GX800_04895 [Clostridiaceae bacterium]|nr:hypothetical protein [Clostridiaceae bacterium]
MAYANFKATVWSKYIQHELETKAILSDWCNKKFEGEAKHNEMVKILGVGKPTIGNYVGTTIGSPETLEDSSTFLKIDQAKYFNFMVDDVDRAQSQPGLMEALMKETTRAMALERDKHIATMALEAGTTSSGVTQVDSATDAKQAIDAGILALRELDVDSSMEVVIEIPWFVYNYFRDQLVTDKTDNDELVKKGIIAMYDGCYVRPTNNLYVSGTDYYAMVRTKDAIAFASGIDKVEAYRPETLFSDAIKGLNTFGAKVVRPKELYAMRVKK